MADDHELVWLALTAKVDRAHGKRAAQRVDWRRRGLCLWLQPGFDAELGSGLADGLRLRAADQSFRSRIHQLDAPMAIEGEQGDIDFAEYSGEQGRRFTLTEVLRGTGALDEGVAVTDVRSEPVGIGVGILSLLWRLTPTRCSSTCLPTRWRPSSATAITSNRRGNRS